MPLLPGELLNKRYRIAGLLGQGDYGAVYYAWDVHDRAAVAVKEYLDASVETQKRFRAEARELSQLQHAQLPAVRDHFALEGVGQYLVSDYVPGVSLADLLAQYGPVPSPQAIDWLQAACAPLAYLHDKGRAHLDVKPANIRITPGGDVYLVDSGLVGLGIAPGKRGYAAPEQEKQSAETGPLSDIYGLGATLYSLLTDTVPPGALQRESGLEELKPAREVNPDVEPYLSIVASRAMSLRPDTRYESVSDFAAALERPTGRTVPAAEGAPRRTPETSTVAPLRTLPQERRRQIEMRTIWGLLGLLVVVIIAGLALVQAGPEPLFGGDSPDATATRQAEVIAALTAVAPTITPTPLPSPQPTATPEPIMSKTGSRLLYMPGGSFLMGNDEGARDEQPSKMISLDAYYIDETEVTNGAYAQCVAAGACEEPATSRATFYRDYYGNSEFNDYPVIYVNWNQAQDFCEWREGRLPTEAEWERAAGFDPESGVKYDYPWGDEFDGDLLNYCDTNCFSETKDDSYDDGYRDTAPVGTYPEGRSPLGVYDMLGNVMEWTADWYDSGYYTVMTESNPLGPLEGFTKSVRGGSWLATQEELGVSVRTFYEPGALRANIGFRCAQSLP